MPLVRRRPSRELGTFQDLFDTLFENGPSRRAMMPWSGFGAESLPVDVYEEGDDVMVKASVPGIDPEDLHVEAHDDTLRIWGESKSEEERDENDYYVRERRYGRVERNVTLPYAVNAEKAHARFENGVLTLTLPKHEGERRREIKIERKG